MYSHWTPRNTIVIWAEEAATLSGNQREWSFGNGATGVIGILLPEDWYLHAMTFQCDVFPAGRTVTVEAENDGVSIPGAQVVATSDKQIISFSTPILLPAGTVLGYRTVSVLGGGGVSDGRVASWLKQ